MVRNVKVMEDLGWRKTTLASGCLSYIPCFRLHSQNPPKPGKVRVRYLGTQWKLNRRLRTINTRDFYSIQDAKALTAENDQIQCLDMDDRECLGLFLSQYIPETRPVKRKKEELSIMRSWEQVKRQQRSAE
jgi:hypothetical protein